MIEEYKDIESNFDKIIHVLMLHSVCTNMNIHVTPAVERTSINAL